MNFLIQKEYFNNINLKVRNFHSSLFLFLFNIILCSGINAADTLHVRTHYRQTVVTDPALPIAAQTSFGLYPTRTNDKTTFDYYANFPEDVVVRILTDPGGNVVEEHRYNQLKEGVFTYDLSRFPKGRFYLSVLVNNEEKFKKRIRLKE